jgi:serine/threonine protein phosphatase PrpC
LKKKRSNTEKVPKEIDSPATVKGGPYRNIEESKKHQVSSFPDIKKIPIKTGEQDFIICACDGIWDCYSNE